MYTGHTQQYTHHITWHTTHSPTSPPNHTVVGTHRLSANNVQLVCSVDPALARSQAPAPVFAGGAGNQRTSGVGKHGGGGEAWGWWGAMQRSVAHVSPAADTHVVLMVFPVLCTCCECMLHTPCTPCILRKLHLRLHNHPNTHTPHPTRYTSVGTTTNNSTSHHHHLFNVHHMSRPVHHPPHRFGRAAHTGSHRNRHTHTPTQEATTCSAASTPSHRQPQTIHHSDKCSNRNHAAEVFGEWGGCEYQGNGGGGGGRGGAAGAVVVE